MPEMTTMTTLHQLLVTQATFLSILGLLELCFAYLGQLQNRLPLSKEV